jgi:hypothetical protein
MNMNRELCMQRNIMGTFQAGSQFGGESMGAPAALHSPL